MYEFFSELPGLNINYFAYVQPVGRGGIRLGWLNVGSELKRGEEQITSKISENTLSLAYGISVSKNVYIGLNLKRLIVDSEIGGGAGFGLDFGGLLLLTKKDLLFRFYDT